MIRISDVGSSILAFMIDEMPNSTLPIKYSTGRRPTSSFQSISTGTPDNDSIPEPYLHVEISDEATWRTEITGQEVKVEIKGTVYDTLSDISGINFPNHVEINSDSVPLSFQTESPSWGRPNGFKGTFRHKFRIDFGISVIRVKVVNSLGVSSEKLFQVEVNEENNNFQNPSSVIAKVRPISQARLQPLPHIHYLYAQGTFLGEGISPATNLNATISSLKQFPDNDVRQTRSMSMNHLHTPATHYGSRPFLIIRENLIDSSQTPPPNVLLMPLGGRLEWQTSIPNILGSYFVDESKTKPS